MIGTLLTLFAVGLVSLVAIGIALAALGIVFSVVAGVSTFLLFKVAPIVLLGWVVLKIFDRGRSKKEISAADREWLESGS